MLGVFNIEIAKAYIESLFFLVQKLKDVMDEIKNIPSKAGAVVGLKRVIEQSQKELRSCEAYLKNENFINRASNIPILTDQSPDIQQSLVKVNSIIHDSELNNQGGGTRGSARKLAVVVKPKYAIGPDGKENLNSELETPDKSIYQEISYDTLKDRNKEYRLLVDKPLENSDYIKCSVFDSISINSGKQLKVDQSLWERIVSRQAEHKSVGKYKGASQVFKKNTIADLQHLELREELAKYDLPSDLKSWNSSTLDKDIVTEVEVRVRLYLIEAEIADKMDFGSDADVYTQIYLGSKLLFDNKDKRINDRQNPKFYCNFEFKAVFPGPSTLKIKFLDYDPIGFDEFIGMTEIDLEDRFFDRRWSSTPDHPIEKRDIRKNNLSKTAGTVKLWIDIDRLSDTTRMKRRLQDISPIPEMMFELRIIIWQAEDVPLLDIEGLADVYVSCSFPTLSKVSSARSVLEHRHALALSRLRIV